MTFDEICRRASGRRAYNAKRRRQRARRISAILALQDRHGDDLPGRVLARTLKVHESTISRDLKFIARVRAAYCSGSLLAKVFTDGRPRMLASSFKWLRGARGYETVYEWRADRGRVR
jgi:hypothetical protein